MQVVGNPLDIGNGSALAGDTRAEEEGFEPPRANVRPPSGPPPSVEISLPQRLKHNTPRYTQPGEPAELSFEATTTGRFPIEDHDTEAELGTLIVQPR
jgi:hypothetical protein